MAEIEPIYFESHGTRCSGDLYVPKRPAPWPLVIMAHGFAAEKTFCLAPFAKRFAEAGYGAFIFDYRSFGMSEGEPRHYVNPWRQLEDWASAIDHLRAMDTIDANRIILWGTSFSGGHVLVTASRRTDIAAVVAQVPYLSGVATLGTKAFTDIVQSSVLGTIDICRAVVHWPPLYVPVVEHAGTFGVLNTPDAWDGYMQLVPEESDWKNEVTARSLLFFLLYNPIGSVSQINVPALILFGELDTIAPAKAARKAVARIPNCEWEDMKCGHFELYKGALFEPNITRQLAFLKARVPAP